MVLERQFSGQFNMNVISDHARKHEMKLFSQANSTVLFVNFSMFSDVKLMFCNITFQYL